MPGPVIVNSDVHVCIMLNWKINGEKMNKTHLKQADKPTVSL